jgi:hypothetical protein
MTTTWPTSTNSSWPQLHIDLEDLLDNSGVVESLQDVVLESEATPDQRLEAMEQLVGYFAEALKYRYLGFKAGGLKKFNPDTGQYEPVKST